MDFLSADYHLAGVMAAHGAKNRLEQLASAVTQQAGDSQHLTGPDGKGDIPEMLPVAQILQAQHFISVVLIPFQGFRPDFVAHHILGQLLGIGILHQTLGHHTAVTQDGIAVADFHDLAKLMGDEDNSDALLLQRAHHSEDPLNFRLRQRGGRLVHNDNGGILHQSPGNLHDLLVAGIQIPNHGIGIQLQIHALEQLLRLFPHQGLVQQTSFVGQMGQEHILVDRQIVDEIQLLVDESHAGVQRFQRRCKMYFLPVQANGAAVGGKNAAQNIHQGRFAGTVFSQQRTDFPGSQGEVHIPQYTVRPEGFVDFLH